MNAIRITLCSLVLLVATAPLMAQGTYTQIDVPGAIQTQAYDIDTAGDIVGTYVDSSGSIHGFLLSAGIFTTLDVPGASYTGALGTNDLGQVVGITDTDSFLYDVATQAFTELSYPGLNTTTFAYDVNNQGIIVGYVQGNGANGPVVGFELNGTRYIKIAFPKAHVPYTYLTGINNSGEVIGQASTGQQTKPFSYDTQHKFATISIPGLSSPVALRLNDVDALVGLYRPTSTSLGGFVYQNGSLQQLEFPGSNITYAYSINNAGEVVGFFYDSQSVVHGFLWTPSAAAPNP